MLEITIYKVQHGGRSEADAMNEARKLIPYILKSDAFSLEMTLPAEEAQSMTGKWARVLQDPSWSRTSVRRMLERSLQDPGAADHNETTYMLALNDYFFRNKVGLWFAEQYPTNEASSAIRAAAVTSTHEVSEFRRMVREGRTGAERLLYANMKQRYERVVARDERIGEVARSAEEGIRAAHPWLVNKETIHWGIPIGALHATERYIPNATVVNLTTLTPYFEQLRQLHVHIEEGKPFEDAIDLLHAIAHTEPLTKK